MPLRRDSSIATDSITVTAGNGDMKFARNAQLFRLDIESGGGCGSVRVVVGDREEKRRHIRVEMELVGNVGVGGKILLVVHEVRGINRNRVIRTGAEFIDVVDGIVCLNVVVQRGGDRQTSARGKSENADLMRIMKA